MYLKYIVFDICIYYNNRILNIYNILYIYNWNYIYIYIYMYTIETKINQNDCIDPSSRPVSCSDENLSHMQSKYVPHHVNNKTKNWSFEYHKSLS